MFTFANISPGIRVYATGRRDDDRKALISGGNSAFSRERRRNVGVASARFYGHSVASARSGSGAAPRRLANRPREGIVRPGGPQRAAPGGGRGLGKQETQEELRDVTGIQPE